MAGAAASVILISLVGGVAIAGILPNSNGTDAETARIAARTVGVAPGQAQQVADIRPVVNEDGKYKTAELQKPTIRHNFDQFYQHQAASARARQDQVARAEPARQYFSAPVFQQPAPVAQTSPHGIGLGAVVGGLVGSQVGGGNGPARSEITGAVGGGYVGDEIGKRNQ